MDFDVEFKPFLLDPSLKEDTYVGSVSISRLLLVALMHVACRPVIKRAKYEQKFGGRERVAAMEKTMIARGKEVGINLCVAILRQL